MYTEVRTISNDTLMLSRFSKGFRIDTYVTVYNGATFLFVNKAGNPAVVEYQKSTDKDVFNKLVVDAAQVGMDSSYWEDCGDFNGTECVQGALEEHNDIMCHMHDIMRFVDNEYDFQNEIGSAKYEA